jgi:hypothetical protein
LNLPNSLFSRVIAQILRNFGWAGMSDWALKDMRISTHDQEFKKRCNINNNRNFDVTSVTRAHLSLAVYAN